MLETSNVTPDTGSSPADSGQSYVASITGAADPESVSGILESESTGEVIGEEAQGTGAGPEIAAEDAPAEDLFDEIAREAGFENLKTLTPAQREELKKVLADGKFADRLSGKPQAEATAPVEELTELEKEIAAAAQPDAAPKTPITEEGKPTVTAPAKAGGYGDIGDKWREPKDAYNELNDAYREGDLAKVHDVEAAMFVRRFDGLVKPRVEQMVQERVREALKQAGINDVIPQVQRDLSERRSVQNRDFAAKQVSSLPGNEKFAEIFAETPGSQKLTFKGNEYPDTPYNRIIMANPELNNISVPHSDPNKAEQLTMIAIYKAAARLHKQSQTQAKAIQPEQAKRLVKAGAELQQRTGAETDRTRQTMNAGKGSTGVGSKGERSYVSELTRPAGEFEVADLLA